jgi:hypothetical protein
MYLSLNIVVVYSVRNKLIVSITTGFNCNQVLGCLGFKKKLTDNTLKLYYKNQAIKDFIEKKIREECWSMTT